MKQNQTTSVVKITVINALYLITKRDQMKLSQKNEFGKNKSC